MRLVVNGVDFEPYLVERGYKVTREDVDGPNATRTMDLTMHRDRLGTKYGIDAGIRLLKGEDAKRILSALMPETVPVVYDNPYTALKEVKTTMYVSKGSATVTQSYDGVDLWEIDTIHFAEV